MDSDASGISPSDRDMMIRTVIGEAGNQPDIGKVAVASTILNRLAAGGYGDTATAVVTAPNQFEPWSSKAGQLMSFSPNDPAYQNAARAVDMAVSGQAPDPTGGATNFYSPSAQAALGRQPPAWAKGQAVQIGAHLFYGGKGGAAQPATGGTSMAQADPSEISDGEIEKLMRGQGAPASSQQAPASAATTSASASPQPGEMSDDDIGALLTGKSPASVTPAAVANDTSDAHPLTITAGGPGTSPQAQFGTLDAAKAALGTDPSTSAAAAAASGAIGGIPIAGPAALGGMERLSAFERSNDLGTSYNDELNNLQLADALRQQAHPIATTAGQIGGNVLAFGGLGATEAGATALGMGSGPLTLRAALAGATGAMIGGGDAAVRNAFDPQATGLGALAGFGAGFAGPLAGKAVEAGANALAPLVRGFMPSQAATTAINNALLDTGGDMNALAQRLADNPRLSLMDVNPGARTLAQGLAAQPGDARNALVQVLNNRTAGAQDAVTGAYDAAMGPTPDVLATLNGIRQTAATNAQRGFGQALANAKPVDLTAAIQGLDNEIRPGIGQVVSSGSDLPLSPIQQRLQQIRNQIATPDNSEMLTDATRLHQLQSNLRTEGETLLSSSSGSDRLQGRAVMNARNSIVDAIDDATGGQFKPAQQQYASDMAIGDAFNRGLSIFKNGSGVSGLEDRPEYWRAFVGNATPAERDALTLGVRTAADQAMSSVRNPALRGETITMTPANLAKLRAVIGDDQATQLAQRMTDEHDMAATNNALFQGSQTQPREAARLAVAVRNIAPISAEVGLPTLAGMMGHSYAAAGMTGAALARRGVQLAGRAADRSRNALMGTMLSADGPQAGVTLNRLLAAQNGAGAVPSGIGTGANAFAQLAGAPAPTNALQAIYGRVQGPADLQRRLRALSGR